MHCATCRELLSADLDGELDELDRPAMDAHVADCPGCAAFGAAAADAHRSVRLSAADPVPDLTASILATNPTPAPADSGASVDSRAASRRRVAAPNGTFLRYALGVVAATQLVLALPELFDPSGSSSTLHDIHHLGAWDLAFAVGLLVVAVQPWRARGLLPMCAALAGVMVVTAVIDVAGGRTPGLAESSHVLQLFGLGLVWQLSRAPWAGAGPGQRRGIRSGGPGDPGDPAAAPATGLGGLRLLGRRHPGATTASSASRERPAA
jgi:predicted anti-sigma-YlaC factor YlaD